MQFIARHAGMGRPTSRFGSGVLLLIRRNAMCPAASRAPISLVGALRAIGLLGAALSLAACGGSHDDDTNTIIPTGVISNYTIGGTITGLTTSSVVLANATATVTVSAGATSWVFPSSFAPGTSYSISVKTQPTGEVCAVTSGATGTNTGAVGNVAVACSYGQWTWEGGINTVNAAGVYGTLGSAAATNMPGARYAASSRTDSSGNFWLFGGVGYDAAGVSGYLNDLWEFSPASKEWTWVSGGTADNASGVYGTQGTAAAANIPGARTSASSWIDSTGNLWVFGGVGYDSTGAVGSLNDLWKYAPATGQWTWIGGANVENATGVYGTEGTAAAGDVPGARYSATTWIDSAGNMWLFGGVGYDSAGAVGNLNDLWKYTPSTGLWTWVNGSSGHNASGVYGTQSTAAATNVPGSRYSATSWIDSTGDLWLFGGYGVDSTGVAGKLNDLWEYTASNGQWTWISGEGVVNISGIYYTLGTATIGYVPGARQAATSWVDSSGNLWLFGGVGYGGTGVLGNLNDLWKFAPGTKEWTWVGGVYTDNAIGVFGTLGTGSPGDVVGARNSASSWIDSSGNFWLFGGYGYDSNGTLSYLNDLWQYNPKTGS
jgi:N-acetylneuraminic acid mutarotase